MRMVKVLSVIYLLAMTLTGVIAGDRNFMCEGIYEQHLQGFDGDKDALYWSFTTTLVKSDFNGKKIAAVPVRNHHGDLCVADGRIYVIANYGRFNKVEGNAKNFVEVYNTVDLSRIASYPVPEIKHGGGAICRTENGFMITGGLPDGFPGNLLYEYDRNFKFIRSYQVPPWTLSGVQTIIKYRGDWLLGCHRSKLLRFDKDFKLIAEYKLDATHGIMIHPRNGELYYAYSRYSKGEGWRATVFPLGDTGLERYRIKELADGK